MLNCFKNSLYIPFLYYNVLYFIVQNSITHCDGTCFRVQPHCTLQFHPIPRYRRCPPQATHLAPHANFQCPIDVPTKNSSNTTVLSGIRIHHSGLVLPSIHFDDINYAPKITQGKHVNFILDEAHGHNYHLNVIGAGSGKGDRYDYIGEINVYGVEYDLVQLHLHYKSENSLDGVEHDLEAHLVHINGNDICVLAVFFQKGEGEEERNPELDKILNAMKAKDDKPDAEVTVAGIDFQALVGERNLMRDDSSLSSLVSFEGSLTTPPFTEGVMWVVNSNVMIASRHQINEFMNLKHVHTPNDRDIQPRNGRMIMGYKKFDDDGPGGENESENEDED